jgi:hypothetical protein
MLVLIGGRLYSRWRALDHWLWKVIYKDEENSTLINASNKKKTIDAKYQLHGHMRVMVFCFVQNFFFFSDNTRRKSSGPSTDPCRTSLTTGSWLEISPSNTTCWFLLLRNDSTHLQVVQVLVAMNHSTPSVETRRDPGTYSSVQHPKTPRWAKHTGWLPTWIPGKTEHVEYPVIKRGQLGSHHWFNPTTFSESTRRSTVINILDQMVSKSTRRSTVITILDLMVSEST